MKSLALVKNTPLAICLLLLAACNVEEKPANAAAGPAAEAVAALPPAPVPATSKIDPVDEARLDAGLKIILPRIVGVVDGNQKVEPKGSRLFMHPDQDKNAEVELDTTGLTSVTLSPYILDISGNKDCMVIKDAGVVEVSWALDGAEPNSFVVDTEYADLVTIDLTNSSRLKIVVNQGNGVPWCDWSGIGFFDVKP